jgi:hypothetical protein
MHISNIQLAGELARQLVSLERFKATLSATTSNSKIRLVADKEDTRWSRQDHQFTVDIPVSQVTSLVDSEIARIKKALQDTGVEF